MSKTLIDAMDEAEARRREVRRQAQQPLWDRYEAILGRAHAPESGDGDEMLGLIDVLGIDPQLVRTQVRRMVAGHQFTEEQAHAIEELNRLRSEVAELKELKTRRAAAAGTGTTYVN